MVDFVLIDRVKRAYCKKLEGGRQRTSPYLKSTYILHVLGICTMHISVFFVYGSEVRHGHMCYHLKTHGILCATNMDVLEAMYL
jgi:anthranilate/para-aminobenzoate synthase component II